jgi:O-antigen ligase
MATLLLSFFVLIEIFSKGWGNRLTLFFSNSNYLAIALLPGFTILLFSQIKYWQILSLVVLVSIFATGSRSVELSVVFILSLFLLSNIKRFNKNYLIVFLLILMTTLVLFFDTIVIKQKIDGTRLVISKIVLNVFSENPVNGIGYGQFRTHYYQYIDQDIRDMSNYEFQHAIKSYDESLSDEELLLEGITSRHLEKMTHNDFYTVIAELGLVGLAFLIFLFYKLYVELKKLLLHSRNNFFLSIGLIGGSLVFSLFHNNLTSFVFWFVLFVPFIMNRNYERTT